MRPREEQHRGPSLGQCQLTSFGDLLPQLLDDLIDFHIGIDRKNSEEVGDNLLRRVRCLHQHVSAVNADHAINGGGRLLDIGEDLFEGRSPSTLNSKTWFYDGLFRAARNSASFT